METLNILTTAGEWFKDQGAIILVGIVFGIFTKQGWTIIIKKFSSRAKVVSKELGELFSESAVFFGKLDDAIKNDGSLVENSAKELIAAGKELIAEGKDVIISIKPKPAAPE